jgi:cell volume regulation protein A
VSVDLGVDGPLLLAAMLLLVAVVVTALMTGPGRRLRIPGALVVLGLGMLFGDDGLGLVSLNDPGLVQNLGVVALLFILLEGGLTTKPTDLRLAALPGALLATVGVLVTAAITGVGVWLLVDADPVTAALIGGVVASTDAAAVFSMMRTTTLPRRVSALLRFESGANDPIAVMLTVGLLSMITEGDVGASDWVAFAALQLVGGLATGGAVGGAGVLLLRRVPLGSEGLYPVVVAALGGMAYGMAVAVGASGFVAVYVTGLLIGALVPRHRPLILGTHEALANAAEIGLFMMLGLLVFPSQLLDVAPAALLVAVVLTLVARPTAVLLCTLGQGFKWRERALISWAGLRGAVPIVLATFPFTAGLEGASVVFNIVFFVVLVSVLVQGIGLQPLVDRLHLQATERAWFPVAQALPLQGLDVDLVEVRVTRDLHVAGHRLVDVPLPERMLVTTLIRDDTALVPSGDTRLHDGDRLLISVSRSNRATDALTAWARGEPVEPWS